ncbi:MAG: D-alanine--D-alanine ligase [Chitinispirillales bacterium]|jgi:D-alanine-D-alanine ligase|nr:D-alanine--D-alanine ligase [Chitinispirillales bacterium]
MEKKKIVVVMGGPSAEHEISLKTGFQILSNLDKNKYSVSALVISKNKEFRFAQNTIQITQEDINNAETSPFFRGGYKPCNSMLIWENVSGAFLALHGEFGEDGVFQGYLDTIGVKYTGCGVLSSAVGMNKIFAKKIFEASGITTPPYSIFRKGDSENEIKEILAKHRFPLFVKAPQSGSSKLMSKVENEQDLRSAIKDISKNCNSILVESNVKGDEFSCPVIEIKGELRVLSPIYIKPKNSAGFFDYNAKYLGESEEICPPPHDKEIIELIQKTAISVHKVLECRGYSRTDIIVQDSVAYVLEINTLPGMTSTSLIPKSFAAEGGNFSELLDIIIDNMLKPS